MTKSTIVVLSTLLLCGVARADAPADAWSAARAHAPADAAIAWGADLVQLRSSKAWSKLSKALMAEPEFKKGAAEVKKACKIDVLTVVQGVAMMFSDLSGDDSGVAFISLKGVDAAAFTACMTKLTVPDGKKKIKITASAPDAMGIVTYTAAGQSFHIAALPSGVFAIAFKADSKEMLSHWLSGKGLDAKGDLARSLAKIDTASAMWVAGMSRDGSEKMTGAATITLAAGIFTLKGWIDAGDPKEAAKGLSELNDKVAQTRKDVPPKIAALLDTAKVSVSGSVVNVEWTVPEASASDAWKLFDHMF